jgi:hypothetical protein
MAKISTQELLHKAPYNTDDRSDAYPPTQEVLANLDLLVRRVNRALRNYPEQVFVSSGYRPSIYNKNAGGSPNSSHLVGEAVDLRDKDGKLKAFFKLNSTMLEIADLYMEHPDYTPTWIHLTIRRPKSGARIFRP